MQMTRSGLWILPRLRTRRCRRRENDSLPRIGVYICHCGINIAASIDIGKVTQFSANLPGVVIARDYTYMCSDPGQGLIKQDIAELGLTGWW